MLRPVLLSLAGLAAAVAVANALPYGANSAVISLTKENFAQEVMGSNHPWLVEFYAPWCGHCKNLAPAYEKTAKQLKNLVKIGAVNCDEEKEICGSLQIQGFPTIKAFGQKQVPTKDGKGLHKEPLDYQGARSAKGMIDYALGLLKGFVHKVTDETAEEFFKFGTEGADALAKVVLVSDKPKLTPMYKALSTDFARRLSFGQAVKDKAPAFVEKHGISKFPTILVFTEEGKEPIIYDGEIKRDALFAFLSQHAAPAEQPAQPSKQQRPKKPAPPPPPPEHVHDVRAPVTSQEELEKTCFETNKMCYIAMLDAEDAGHSATLDALEAVSKKSTLQHVFKFVWVSGPDQPQFAESLGVQPYFPAAAVYNHRKQRVVPFVGAFTEKSISQSLDKILRGARGTSGFELQTAPALVAAEPRPAVDEDPVQATEPAGHASDEL